MSRVTKEMVSIEEGEVGEGRSETKATQNDEKSDGRMP